MGNVEINRKTASETILKGLLALVGAVSVGVYLENTYQKTSATSILIVIIFIALYFLWKMLPKGETRRFYCTNIVYSILFSFFMVYGQRLDYIGYAGAKEMLLTGTGMTTAIIPVVMVISKSIEIWANKKTRHDERIVKAIFWMVAFVWFIGFLAAFPGIYAVDAPMWYLEFDDPKVPISSRWSPVYAGAFYFFVSSGYKLTGSYGAGLAFFIALQSLFLLFVVWKILCYTHDLGGVRAAGMTGLFFGLVPTHMIMSLQTAQGAPFMGCFAMMIMHICRMVGDPEKYWGKRKNVIMLVFWGVISCILRNNAYYAFALFLAFIILYEKKYRKKLMFSILTILLVVTVYKGPVLDACGVTKGTALMEMMSMPLQQMACVYNEYPERISESQRIKLQKYVPADALVVYEVNPSISDTVKGNLDIEYLKKNMGQFIKLYLVLGARAPQGYIKAAYMQNLGLCYIDKSYPDARMYHPYIHYASYDLPDPNYIKIERHSLLPIVDKLLGKLYGYTPSGYGGEVVTLFDDVPVVGVACRASTYFWILLYLVAVGIISKKKEYFVSLGLMLGYTFTILIGPVVMYRYYAPIIFSMPILIAYMADDMRRCLKQQHNKGLV